jgi:DnaJ-class molecular chaperone
MFVIPLNELKSAIEARLKEVLLPKEEILICKSCNGKGKYYCDDEFEVNMIEIFCSLCKGQGFKKRENKNNIWKNFYDEKELIVLQKIYDLLEREGINGT